MNQNVDRTGAGLGLKTRTLEQNGYTECYIVGTVEESAPTAYAAGAQFAQAASIMRAQGIQPMQEKIYGRIGARGEILQARDREYERGGVDAAVPVTFIDETPVCESDYAGLQIWGVAPRDGSRELVTSVVHNGRPVGRAWVSDGFRMLHLAQVRGTRADGTLPRCGTRQVEQMFRNVSAALQEEGCNYLQVARTWIYLARILDWYGEFNRVRTAFYSEQGMAGDPRDTVFPASTGIGCRSAGEECSVDVLALEVKDKALIQVKPILGSWRQPPAFSYGSAFSRGVSVEIEGKKTIYISGTASINPEGKSIYIDDEEAQAVEALKNVAAILEDHGGGLENICSATVFSKTPEAYEAYRHVTRLLCVPEFPSVAVLADVCRSELLIEIEATAVI